MKKIHILEYKNNTIQQTQIKPDDLRDFQKQEKKLLLILKKIKFYIIMNKKPNY